MLLFHLGKEQGFGVVAYDQFSGTTTKDAIEELLKYMTVVFIPNTMLG